MFITVTSYEEFGHFARAFGEGKIPLLLVVGAPGTSKTQTILNNLKVKHEWIDGHLSPISLYMRLYHARNQLVVIDDVDAIYANKSARGMLKALCQTNPVKKVTWETRSRILDEEKVPRSFSTRSNVCIIANEWRTTDEDVLAIEDRAIGIRLEPTPLELHKHVATWFKDQVAFDFVGSIAHLIETPSIRNYLAAAQLHKSIDDWRDVTLRRCVRPEHRAIWEIRHNPALKTEKARVRAFVAGKHGSRATYFRLVKKMPRPISVPSIKLKSRSRSESPARPAKPGRGRSSRRSKSGRRGTRAR